MGGPTALHIRDFKPYVPAKDLERSKRFYAALGFTPSEGFGGTVDDSLVLHVVDPSGVLLVFVQ